MGKTLVKADSRVGYVLLARSDRILQCKIVIVKLIEEVAYFRLGKACNGIVCVKCVGGRRGSEEHDCPRLQGGEAFTTHFHNDIPLCLPHCT